jgi:hypothetical protein
VLLRARGMAPALLAVFRRRVLPELGRSQGVELDQDRILNHALKLDLAIFQPVTTPHSADLEFPRRDR